MIQKLKLIVNDKEVGELYKKAVCPLKLVSFESDTHLITSHNTIISRTFNMDSDLRLQERKK